MKDSTIIGAMLIAGAVAGWALGNSSEGPAGMASYTPRFLDRRANARLSTDAAKYTRMRGPNEKVTGVVLHQMSFSRGNDPSRYDAVTAHYRILPDGTIVWAHDHAVRLPAADRFNGYTISVEFAGNLPSKEGSRDPRDFYKPEKFGMDNLTREQVMAGRWLLWMLSTKYGIRQVFGHVQSDAGKGNDPGPAIWRNIAMYAKRNLGMDSGGPGHYIQGGSPIPARWEREAVAA